MDHCHITISTILIITLAGGSARATTFMTDPATRATTTITIDPATRATTTITTDPIISTDSGSCVIPFTRAGNLILIQAKADTTTGFFVLDTGTPGLVLNLTYFRRYPTTNPVESGGVTGTVMSARTTVDSFHLGPIKYYRLDADLINLGHIENNKGVKIFGLMGLQLFERFEMIIDYSSNRIYLHLINRKETAAYRNPQFLDSATCDIIPINIEQDKMIVYLFLKGRKLKFIIDTAAETNVLDSRLPTKVFEQVEITRRVTLDGSGSHKVETLSGNLKGLRLGNRDLEALPVLQPNYTFRLNGYPDAREVYLAGDFNDWTPNALRMKRVGGTWVFDVHLSTGKHLYMFIVDGHWIRDPDNPLWEGNEYRTDNSILWMEER